MSKSPWDWLLPKKGRIDIYPQQYKQDTSNYQKGFKTESYDYYQGKESYEAQRAAHPDWFEQKYLVSGATAANKAGYYPAATELPNGILIVCYPQEYQANAPFNEQYYLYDSQRWTDDPSETGDYIQDLAGTKITVKIVVKNSYDDIRLVAELGNSSTNNWYTLDSYKDKGIDSIKGRGDTGNASDSSLNTNPEKAPELSASQFVAGGAKSPKMSIPGQSNPQPFTYFRVGVKDGYSIPTPKMEAVTFPSGSYTVTDIMTVKDKKNVTAEEFEQNKFIEGVLGTDMPFYSPPDSGDNDSGGYFNYSIFVKDSNGSNHIVTFESKLINFNTSYDKLTNKNQYNLNADTARYFSIPFEVPATSAGKSFGGWKLSIVGGTLSEQLTNPNDKEGIFKPGDLVDVSELYNQLKKKLADAGQLSKAINVTQFELKFTADMKTTDEPLSGTSYVTQRLQVDGQSYATKVDSTDGDENGRKTSITAMSGSIFQISGVTDSYTYNGTKYTQNTSSSATIGSEFVENFDPKNENLLTVSYDKNISVTYDTNGGGGAVPTDTGTYTTMANSSNPSTITVQDGSSLTSTNGKFLGWKLKADGEKGTVEGKVYYKNGSIDLSTLSGESNAKALRDAIFQQGRVTLVAQYGQDVAEIRNARTGNLNGDNPTSKEAEGKWIYEGGGETGNQDDDKTFAITAKFKYGGTSDSYTKARNAGFGNSGGIHVALYKKNPNGQTADDQYQLWWGRTKDGSSVTSYGQNHLKIAADPTLSTSLDSNNCFTVTFKIKNSDDNVTYQWDNDANYRIYAWTKANDVDGSKFGGDTGYATQTMSVKDADTPTKLPWVTTTTRVLDKLVPVSGSAKFETKAGTNLQEEKKLLYKTQKVNLTFKVKTEHNQVVDQDTINSEYLRLVGKQEPSWNTAKDIKVLFFKGGPLTGKTDSTGASPGVTGGYTSDGVTGNGKVKLDVPKITSNNDGTYTVTIPNISDDGSDSLPNTRWASGAQYYTYVWNKSNENSGETIPMTKNEPNIKDGYLLSNKPSDITVPGLHATTYFVDNTTSGEDSNVPDTMIKYPNGGEAYTLIDDSSKDKVYNHSSGLTVSLQGIYAYNNGMASEESYLKPSDKTIQHDYGYNVGIVDENAKQTNQVVLSQKQSDGSVSKMYAKYSLYDESTKKFTPLSENVTSLGKLGFASAGSDYKQSIRFGLEADRPTGNYKKGQFTGKMYFVFTKSPLSSKGEAS